MEVRPGVAMSHGPKEPGAASAPASGKAPGQHGGFVVAVKQERGEGPRAGEKGSHEEEVRVPALLCRWALALKLRPELNLNLLWLRPQSRIPFPS